MRQLIYSVVLTAVALGPFLPLAYSQDVADERFDQITKRIERVELRRDYGTVSGVFFLFAAFCALWAQNTNRNPWLWFFLGWFFHVLTVLVVLAKNSDDQRRARGEPAAGAGWIVGAIILGIALVGAVAFWLFAGGG